MTKLQDTLNQFQKVVSQFPADTRAGNPWHPSDIFERLASQLSQDKAEAWKLLEIFLDAVFAQPNADSIEEIVASSPQEWGHGFVFLADLLQKCAPGKSEKKKDNAKIESLQAWATVLLTVAKFITTQEPTKASGWAKPSNKRNPSGTTKESTGKSESDLSSLSEDEEEPEMHKKQKVVSTPKKPTRKSLSNAPVSTSNTPKMKTPRKRVLAAENGVRASPRVRGTLQWNDGDFVMALHPEWWWWPCVVISSENVPEGIKIRGTKTEDSVVVKSVPTGGDWRYLNVSNVRNIESDELDKAKRLLEATGKDPETAPMVWRKWEDSLLEGLSLVQDGKKATAWLKKPTAIEKDLLVELKGK